MHPASRQPQPSPYNDYIISQSAPGYKLLSSQDRSISSNSIYYQQNGLSRKKLTVISRDNSRPEFRGDYLMTENADGLGKSHSHRMRDHAGYSPLRNNDSSNMFAQRHSHATQSLSNSRVHKSKLKRPISPAPMTPTKALKLKKSMLSQHHQQSASHMSEQRSANNSIARRKFQSQVTSPMKIPMDGHRRLASTTSDAPVMYGVGDHAVHNLETVRREVSSLMNLKVLEFQAKLKQQDQTIRFLENRLNENQRQLKEKDMIIQQMNVRERAKTQYLTQEANKPKHLMNTQLSIDQQYLIKRVKDLQAKHHVFYNQQHQIETFMESLNSKVSLLETQLIKLNGSKLGQLKLNLSKFLQQKATLLSSLAQSISYLDNKLIGRTQAIKETLCELKQKVKEAEDSWTHKDTKETKQSTTIGTHKQDPEQSTTNFNKTSAVRRVQNKLREITSFDDIKDSPYKHLQGSLEFSLTSYDQETARPQNKQVRNVYYEKNMNEMEDVSIGVFGDGHKDESSRLTDDFYYPGSTGNSSRMTSRNVSPINPKKQANQYYGPKQSSKATVAKNQSPLSTKSPTQAFKPSPIQQSPPSQQIVRISNQQISKKIACIQQLIQTKKTTSCESIEKGQLRCYVDKTGYLKYTDSKTFVFDRKGNLIPCTEGEFWFLATKGLIYGKRDQEQSRTMSFIQFDE